MEAISATGYCHLAEECFFLAAVSKDREAAAQLVNAGNNYLRCAARWLADPQDANMADNGTIYINQLNIEPHTGGITAITLTAVYGDTKAEATILLRPGQSIPETEDSIRDQIRQLGEALQRAARSPERISSSLRA